MVVCHLRIVNDTLRESDFLHKRLRIGRVFLQRLQAVNRTFHLSLHVLAQVAAVRSGVGNHFSLFIQALRDIQCLFRGKAEFSVTFPLQFRQIIKQGRRRFLFFLFHLCNRGRLAVCFRKNRLRRVLPVDTGMLLPVNPKPRIAAEVCLYFKIILRRKGIDFLLPLHNQRQCRCLHTPNAQKRVILQGIRPRGVHPYQPVRLTPAFRGGI